MAIIRIFFMAFIALTIIYVSVSLYSRAVRKGKLEREWEEDGRQGDLVAFLQDGMKEYDGSLRRRLILGVYVIPALLVGVIVYFVNYT